MAEITTIADLLPDPRNANKGTQRGRGMLESSVRDNGLGRSVLADRNGVLIAGNKTLEVAADLGMDGVIVVQSDGTKLVVVQRTDLDLSKDKRAKALAIADNRTSEVSLEWDTDVLADLNTEGVLDNLFFENELDNLLGNSEAIDPSELWRGMPEFEHEDLTAHHSIHVHFPSAEAVQEFARLVGQSITDKTKFIWFPKQEEIKYGVAHES